jgi:hypothetical protein
VRHWRAPAVEDGEEADARAEMLRIGCNCEHGFG